MTDGVLSTLVIVLVFVRALWTFSGGGLHKSDFYDVISVENLFWAWKVFCRGKRSKKDVAEFELNLESNIFQLYDELASGTWKPDPYKEFYVQDPKLRKIHKASVRDRVLYQAVYTKLYQIFDKQFIHDSYSSRNKKGTHKGVARFEEFARKATCNYSKRGFALKCDIRKFFDSIDHRILISIVRQKVRDEKLLELIIGIVGSFSVVLGKGLPLGNVTSQILANVYFNEFDQYVKHVLKIQYYARYCDDFVLVHDSREFLENMIPFMGDFLRERLKLELHPRKIIMRKIHHGVDFLGYVSLPHYRVLRTRTKNRMVKKIKGAVELKKSGVISRDVFKHILMSYAGMLGYCKSEKVKKVLREHILFGGSAK